MEQQYTDEFTISRKEGLRGGGGKASSLFRSDDKMKCCLGFYSLHAGISEQKITDVSSPGILKKRGFFIPSSVAWLVDPPEEDRLGNSQVGNLLMMINDSTTIGEAEREQQIAELFAEQGIRVNFVD